LNTDLSPITQIHTYDMGMTQGNNQRFSKNFNQEFYDEEAMIQDSKRMLKFIKQGSMTGD